MSDEDSAAAALGVWVEHASYLAASQTLTSVVDVAIVAAHEIIGVEAKPRVAIVGARNSFRSTTTFEILTPPMFKFHHLRSRYVLTILSSSPSPLTSPSSSASLISFAGESPSRSTAPLVSPPSSLPHRVVSVPDLPLSRRIFVDLSHAAVMGELARTYHHPSR